MSSITDIWWNKIVKGVEQVYEKKGKSFQSDKKYIDCFISTDFNFFPSSIYWDENQWERSRRRNQ